MHSAFDGLDVDGDGKLSLAEAAGYGDIVTRFHRLDRNRDGKLTKAEFDRLAKLPPPKQRAKDKARGFAKTLRQLLPLRVKSDDRLHRQVVGGALGERRAVRLEREQRVARPHPDAVEREQRPARRERALAGQRPSSAFSQRSGRPSGSHSLMSPSTTTRSCSGVSLHHLEELAHLEAALGRPAGRGG